MELQDTIATILRQYGNEVEALLATAARKKKAGAIKRPDQQHQYTGHKNRCSQCRNATRIRGLRQIPRHERTILRQTTTGRRNHQVGRKNRNRKIQKNTRIPKLPTNRPQKSRHTSSMGNLQKHNIRQLPKAKPRLVRQNLLQHPKRTD